MHRERRKWHRETKFPSFRERKSGEGEKQVSPLR